MKKNAFTLIELLVVIAIIAILAAILFPVFASAKLAAKETVSLSDTKQTALALLLYAGDYDDLNPQGAGNCSWGWDGGDTQDFPYDWYAYGTPAYQACEAASWANEVFPYVKNYDVFLNLSDTIEPTNQGWDDWYAHAQKPFHSSNLQFNGLLSSFSTTAVNQPSQLISVWPGWGANTLQGESETNPYLECDDSTQPCVYHPAVDSSCHSGTTNGTMAWMMDSSDNDAVSTTGPFGKKGGNIGYADGHAKFLVTGQTIAPGNTDYRKDPYTAYNSAGVASSSWYEQNACQVLLFRPDFDFLNFGSPVHIP